MSSNLLKSRVRFQFLAEFPTYFVRKWVAESLAKPNEKTKLDPIWFSNWTLLTNWWPREIDFRANFEFRLALQVNFVNRLLSKFNLESISKPISDSILLSKWILLTDCSQNSRWNRFRMQFGFPSEFCWQIATKIQLDIDFEANFGFNFAFQVNFANRLLSKFNLESISKQFSDSMLLSEWLLIANCYQSSTWNWFRSRFQIQFCFPSDLC